MIKIDILETIIVVIQYLDELENYINTLEDKYIKINQKQQDLLHLIENNKLKTNECYRVIKELHKVRLERRKIKNDMELANTFKLHKTQLLSISNREFLKSLLIKKQEQLVTSKYKNRIYTEDELKEMMGSEREDI